MLDGFHPLVSAWFEARFGEPSAPQAEGWPAIQAGRDVLIAAPTGSGKTLAAFLVCLDRLIRQGLSGALPDTTEVLYISPLKALGNDIRKNLEEPLAELRVAAALQYLRLPPIRVAVRSGDTPASQRAAILKKPPHILVTTPESLYLLLTSEGGRGVLKNVRTVILDEIHAVARDKRGAHLALSLERLDALCGRRPVRIGLSATQRPIEEIGRYLVGSAHVHQGQPDCTIVDAGSRRKMDLGVELPNGDLAAVASKEQWAATLDRTAALIQAHRSTLVFVNTRKLVERVSHQLEERLGTGMVGAHHGSMSREARFDSEDKLKRGELRGVVATASLELGIDVGAVELVCQIASPRSFSGALQRIGRSGHWKGATPKGRLFPMTRDELIECAALIRGIGLGKLEQTQIPRHPLDVLSQQIVAMAACEELDENALFERCKRAYPYAELPRSDFDAIVKMLAEGVASRRGRGGAYLHRDEVHGQLRARRGARIAALTCGGAIPDTASFQVVAEPDGVQVGTLDEHFAVDSTPGDVFLLGNTSWRIQRIEGTTVRVEDARGAPPSLPFWEGEAPGRTRELSDEVGQLRAAVEPLLETPEAARDWLMREALLPEAGATQAVAYLRDGRQTLGALPTQQTLIAERFFDDGGGMQLVIHAPFGQRMNRAFGLALRKCFCRSFNFELQAAATDNGILLSLGPQHSFPLESVWEFLSPGMLEDTLTQAALTAPMFGVRWRWNATRSLALLRNQNGKRVPPQIMRMRSDDLLAAVFPMAAACQEHVTGPLEVPDHPLVKETVRDCLHEAMDLPGLRALVEKMRAGELTLLARDLPEPSVLAHEILNSMPYTFLDDAPLEERRARAVSLRRTLSTDDARKLGALDPAAIDEVCAQVWPDPRDADELHDALLTLCFLPTSKLAEGWTGWMDALVHARRAIPLRTANGAGFLATERASVVANAIDGVELQAALPEGFELEPMDRSEACLTLVRGWMQVLGPVSQVALAQLLGMAEGDARDALLALEAEGLVLRGRFREDQGEEFCERSLLARIHRLTLGRLRKEIEPVAAADLIRFLARWQHVNLGAQLHGAHGLAEVIGQLQGFQLAAGAWEREVLAARVRGYHPSLLDELCLSGEVVWGRFAPARTELEVVKGVRRAAPSRTVPIGLALRSELPWLLDRGDDEAAALTEGAQKLEAILARRGASFWSELVGAMKQPAEEVEAALWELVAAGRVTSDGFAGLRALIERGRPLRAEPRADPLSGGGRWSLLGPATDVDAPSAPALALRAEQLLRRYGVVFRDLLTREVRCPPWRELVGHYRRLEARGELRGGRFVSGFPGEQFALPGAVETLRAVRRLGRKGEERVELCAADPLNLVGILTPGPRVPAVLQNRVVYLDGVPQAQGEPELGEQTGT